MCKVTSAGADVGRAWVQMYTAPGGSTAATNSHNAICSTIDARHVWFHQLTGTHAAGTTLKCVIYDPKHAHSPGICSHKLQSRRYWLVVPKYSVLQTVSQHIHKPPYTNIHTQTSKRLHSQRTPQLNPLVIPTHKQTTAFSGSEVIEKVAFKHLAHCSSVSTLWLCAPHVPTDRTAGGLLCLPCSCSSATLSTPSSQTSPQQ